MRLMSDDSGPPENPFGDIPFLGPMANLFGGGVPDPWSGAKQIAGSVAAGGASGVTIGAANAEVMWSCYAWPSSYGNSGKRTFFVNQAGDVLACRNATQRYNGTTKTPGGTAAFLTGVTGATMASTLAANATGLDNERWIVVN